MSLEADVLSKFVSSVINAGPVATILGVWLYTEKRKTKELVEGLGKKEQENKELTATLVELSTKQELGTRLLNDRLKSIDESIQLRELLKKEHGG